MEVLSYISLSFGVRLLSLSKAFYLLRAAMVRDPPESQLSEAMSLDSVSLAWIRWSRIRTLTPSLISGVTNKLTDWLASSWTSGRDGWRDRTASLHYALALFTSPFECGRVLCLIPSKEISRLPLIAGSNWIFVIEPLCLPPLEDFLQGLVYLTAKHLSSCIRSSGHIYDCIERNWNWWRCRCRGVSSRHIAALSFMSNWWRNIFNGIFVINEIQMGLITLKSFAPFVWLNWIIIKAQ